MYLLIFFFFFFFVLFFDEEHIRLISKVMHCAGLNHYMNFINK